MTFVTQLPVENLGVNGGHPLEDPGDTSGQWLVGSKDRPIAPAGECVAERQRQCRHPLDHARFATRTTRPACVSRAESEYAYRLLDEAHQEARRARGLRARPDLGHRPRRSPRSGSTHREILGCECDAEIHRPVPLVRRFGLRREIGLMKREHLGTVGTKTTANVSMSAAMPPVSPTTMRRPWRPADCEDARSREPRRWSSLRASSGETPERHHGVGPDDTIRVRPWLAWKLRTADSVSGPKMPST